MRKAVFFVFALFVAAGLFAQVSLDRAVLSSTKEIEARLPKGATTAVLSFSSDSKAFSDYIVDELATALAASRNLQVIDRQHTEAIRKEFNIQFSGDVSDAEVKKIGQQLGAQYVVTGSLVDIGNAYRFRVAAINIETAVREGSSSLNININDPQTVFLVTGQRPTQTGNTGNASTVAASPSPGQPAQTGNANNSGTYKIGDTGPGGGTVFSAKNGKYMECSGELGRYDYTTAVKVAQDYDGGGQGWRLPTKDELDVIYKNFKAGYLSGFGSDFYWSSSYHSKDKYNIEFKWVQKFSNGKKDYIPSTSSILVRAVRAF